MIYIYIAGGAAGDPNVISEFEAMGLPMMQGYGMTKNSPIIAVNQDEDTEESCFSGESRCLEQRYSSR